MIGWQFIVAVGVALVCYGIYCLFVDLPWFGATFIGLFLTAVGMYAKNRW